MTALLIAAAVVWLGLPFALLGWWFLDRRHERAWEADRPADYYDLPRTPSDLSPAFGWAREATPVHDRIVCEFIEREEGWVS